MFGEAVRICAAVKCTEKMKLLEVEGGTCPSVSAGDATAPYYPVLPPTNHNHNSRMIKNTSF